jgi:hypothetical protein
MTTQFQVGRTYSIRATCDYECIYSFTILSRTAKTVNVSFCGEIVRLKVGIDEKGIEYFMPYGSHSLAPCVGADDPDLSEV